MLHVSAWPPSKCPGSLPLKSGPGFEQEIAQEANDERISYQASRELHVDEGLVLNSVAVTEIIYEKRVTSTFCNWENVFSML